MAGVKRLNVIVIAIMAVVTALNMGLVVNFFAVGGQAFAAAFNSQNIFLLAAAELAAVLLAYIAYKQKIDPAKHASTHL
jgi:Mg/Co/Ni transporter MgtE